MTSSSCFIKVPFLFEVICYLVCLVASYFELYILAIVACLVWPSSHWNQVDFQWLGHCFELPNQRGVTPSHLDLFDGHFGRPKRPYLACFVD